MGLIYRVKVSVLGKIGKINIERRRKLIERLRGRHTKKAGDIKNLHSSKPNISLLFQLDLLTDVRESLQILFSVLAVVVDEAGDEINKIFCA